MLLPALALVLFSPGSRGETVFIDTAPLEPVQAGSGQGPTAVAQSPGSASAAQSSGSASVASPVSPGSSVSPVSPGSSASSRGPVEVFPRSRFGHRPMRIDPGVDESFVSSEVREMDESDDPATDSEGERRESSRSPASLDSGTPAPAAGTAEASLLMARPARHALSPPPEPDPETGASLADTIARRGVQEVSVIAGDLGFFPRTIFVTRDVPVRLFVTGASRGTLCFMMDSFQVRREIRSSKIEEITFTPGMPGRYRFYCPINGMEGSMIVKELSSASELRGPAEVSVQGATAADSSDSPRR